VVNPENGAEHIHPIELCDAKFARPPETKKEMGRLVKSISERVATVDGAFVDIHPLEAPNWYGMKPAGSTRFVGRLKEMWAVHSMLHAADVAQITGVTAGSGGMGQIHGLGGVGKSLLAEEYALHFGAAYPGGIFWIRAYGNDDTKAALGTEQRKALWTDQMGGLAEEMGIKVRDLDAKEIESALKREIERRRQACLWVVDDIP
jgi:hypothetical protein